MGREKGKKQEFTHPSRLNRTKSTLWSLEFCSLMTMTMRTVLAMVAMPPSPSMHQIFSFCAMCMRKEMMAGTGSSRTATSDTVLMTVSATKSERCETRLTPLMLRSQ